MSIPFEPNNTSTKAIKLKGLFYTLTFIEDKTEVNTLKVPSLNLRYPFYLLVRDTYRSHPPSFLMSVGLLVVGCFNLVGFDIGSYFIHPYIAIALIVCGLGMISTMLMANK